VNKGEKMFKVPSKNLKRISSCHILSNFCPEAIHNFGCDFWKNICLHFCCCVLYLC